MGYRVALMKTIQLIQTVVMLQSFNFFLFIFIRFKINLTDSMEIQLIRRINRNKN